MTSSDSPTSNVDLFAAGLSFALDGFQRQACQALDDGHGVLVCAPTGAGKTIVGEFAVFSALAAQTKCFYTTPIKALSNQKYHDLVHQHGETNIGLLTGDGAINSSAPIVVMTTEVLRNMLYANSPALQGLSHVVMDEVHFLADRFRGAVWEEVILHLDSSVRLVSLSATVSNAEEFGDWIQTVRGDTTVIVDEHRPIPLHQHMLVGNRMFDLFARGDGAKEKSKPGVNQELTRYIRQRELLERDRDFGRGASSRRGGPRGRNRGNDRRPVSRPDLISRLDRENLLPVISFIFSRAGCEGAFTQCLRSGLNLLTPEQALRVDAVVDKHVADLSAADQEVLGVDQWRRGLSRGFAAHHAGMLPAFRNAVEELFVDGLIKAVFATETLALGINMPARSVLLERLIKYNGEAHVDLTPGEYTQLTGRAGRRGIDVEGHAVVLWTPDIVPAQVAGLAGARTFPLRSSFAPEYNMAVNLVDRLGFSGSQALLQRSFAQFQADRSVVGQSRKIDRRGEELRKVTGELRAVAEQRNIELDGFLEYMALREEIRVRERVLAAQQRRSARNETVDALASLFPGQVIAVGGKHRGVAVVIEPARDERDPKPLVLSVDAWCGRVGMGEFVNPPEVLGTFRIPRNADLRSGRGRKEVASALRSHDFRPPKQKQHKRSRAADDRELNTMRRDLKTHPAHLLPQGDEVFRLAERRTRIQRDISEMQDAVDSRTSTLAKGFANIVALLCELGYLTDGAEPTITPIGGVLRHIYSESDLLICQVLRRGLWDGLAPAELAAVASAVVYESRGDSYSAPELVTANTTVREALRATYDEWTELSRIEKRHSVDATREPDSGFATAMLMWASGRALPEVLAVAGERGQALPAGDFVRWSRQVIDLLEQLNNASPDTPIASAAKSAVDLIRRGVVAAQLG